METLVLESFHMVGLLHFIAKILYKSVNGVEITMGEGQNLKHTHTSTRDTTRPILCLIFRRKNRKLQ